MASLAQIEIVDQTSARLLGELQTAHKLLLQAMADLDEQTRCPLPARDAIINARWTISRRSLARRNLWKKIHGHLSPRSDRGVEAELERLQDTDRSLLQASSDHVSKWKIDAVMEDWSAYCTDSREIRWKMKAAIGAEIRLLYPLLRTY